MPKFRNIIGWRFGSLVVVARAANLGHQVAWECLCDCGKRKVIRANSLIRRQTVSCGCFNAKKSLRHGKRKSPEYQAWANIKNRCNNPSHPLYKYYGGRGIKLSPLWNDFNNFYSDMGDRPKGRWIERVDNDAGYSPENCIWATPRTQSRNRRSNRYLEHGGKKLVITDWAELLNITSAGLNCALRRGKSLQDVIIRRGLAVQ